MSDKIYWSEKLTVEDDWGKSHDIMVFFYIPSRWWSWKAWKLALDFRWHIHQKLLRKSLESAMDESGKAGGV